MTAELISYSWPPEPPKIPILVILVFKSPTTLTPSKDNIDLIIQKAINSKKYDTIILNYANPDMVGHTGSLEAAVKAIETVDECVGKVVEAVEEQNGVMLITADHGNAEQMVDYKTGEPHTAHTTNPVPLILVGMENTN